jgi:cytochrome P450
VWEWFPRPENISYRQAIAQMDETIYTVIQQRRDSGEDPGELLSMLMNARDEEDGSQMSDKQLRDELATLMLAGHETTANALSWTWMLLAQHPKVRAKLQDELTQVLAGRSPAIADIPQLPYTERVIKESMRLYPHVSIFGREAATDCLGKDFALMEAVLLLATISQRFQLNLIPDFPIVPQPSITLRPEQGIKVQLHSVTTK